MPNLPENGEPTPGTVAGIVTRATVEKAVTEVPSESTKANAGIGPGSGAKLAAKSEANTWFGESALSHATTGKLNSAFGYGTLFELTTGTGNTATGEAALISVTTGGNNTAFGGGAGASITTGESNLFLGFEAGNEEAAATNNKLIIANNRLTPLIAGVMSETAASQQLGFYGTAPKTKPEITGATATVKQLAEALQTIGLVKVN